MQHDERTPRPRSAGDPSPAQCKSQSVRWRGLLIALHCIRTRIAVEVGGIALHASRRGSSALSLLLFVLPLLPLNNHTSPLPFTNTSRPSTTRPPVSSITHHPSSRSFGCESINGFPVRPPRSPPSALPSSNISHTDPNC